MKILLFIHILSVVLWVGGMFFAYFCLRPAAGILAPDMRARLWQATFRLFFRFVAIAVVLVFITGVTMFYHYGFRNAPVGWHIMFTLGVVMILIFGYINHRLYPAFSRLCATEDWPAALQQLGKIRQLVLVNLILSAIVIASATLAV